ncbi:hypothetical protein [Monoglobus pectinilyticus]|uniref:hypothetical protein n=1 Tax=Monoglobus pectinilyticus TaxID=1981510 RepID=UPI0013154296|nr:hypothetical protein [Monoglobus pectinilyticus]
MIKAIKIWVGEHIYIRKSNFFVDKENYYFRFCMGVLYGNSRVRACGDCTVSIP